MIDFKEVQQRLIHHLEEITVLVRNAEISAKVESLPMTSRQIKEENFVENITSQLPTSGNHIYWFEVDKPDKLVEEFSVKQKDANYKMARDNKRTDSKYVYVGSCTKTKLSNRFKQHCGWGAKQTYSLQLASWLGETDLKFTFSYVEIENAKVAVQIEDQVHRDMNPLFGKPGANNKIGTSL